MTGRVEAARIDPRHREHVRHVAQIDLVVVVVVREVGDERSHVAVRLGVVGPHPLDLGLEAVGRRLHVALAGCVHVVADLALVPVAIAITVAVPVSADVELGVAVAITIPIPITVSIAIPVTVAVTIPVPIPIAIPVAITIPVTGVRVGGIGTRIPVRGCVGIPVPAAVPTAESRKTDQNQCQNTNAFPPHGQHRRQPRVSASTVGQGGPQTTQGCS